MICLLILLVVCGPLQILTQEDGPFIDDSELEKRILNGSSGRLWEFPNNVQIRAVNSTTVDICSGILIHPKYVLTAAHCLERFTWFYLSLRYGHWVQVLRSSLIVHPEYSRRSEGNLEFYLNDLALIQLPRYAVLYRPTGLRLPLSEETQRDYFAGQELQASGWGWTSDYGPYPKEIQFTNLIPSTRFQCLNYLQKINVLPQEIPEILEDAFYCILYDDTGMCRGDEGGPLISQEGREGVLVGIASFWVPLNVSTNLCSHAVNIFTNVIPYLSWITSICI